MTKPSRFVIVVNPASGAGSRSLDLLESVLTNTKSIEQLALQTDAGAPSDWPVIRTDKEGLWEKKLEDEVSQNGKDSVLAIGGDGTLLEVATILKDQKDVALLPVPGGRGNDFVRGMFGYDSSNGDFFQFLSRELSQKKWERKPLDLGMINNDVFLNMASIGYGGKIVENVHNRNAFWSKTAAVYQVEGAIALLNEPEVDCVGKAGGETFYEGKFFGAFVGNGRANGSGLFWTPDAKLDDGKLDAVLFEKPSFLKMVQVLSDIKKKRDLRVPHKRFVGNEFSLEFSEPVSLELDGEFIGAAKRHGIKCLEKSLYTWVINS